MAFIDTSDKGLAAQVHQAYSRYIEADQPAEVTFKSMPGKVYPATVVYIVPATAQGQVQLTGMAVQPMNAAPGPFIVRLELDDPEVEAELMPGTVGSCAIYTQKAKMAHVIRKIMIRVTAITNYFKPA